LRIWFRSSTNTRKDWIVTGAVLVAWSLLGAGVLGPLFGWDCMLMVDVALAASAGLLVPDIWFWLSKPGRWPWVGLTAFVLALLVLGQFWNFLGLAAILAVSIAGLVVMVSPFRRLFR
jgi:hypothetical protein